MLDTLRFELDKLKVFNGNIPPAILELTKGISNAGIPSRMKATLAASELILYASQFRRNIKHWNGSDIPINALAFSIAESGSGKDSSVSALRKCFKDGYDKIHKVRESKAKELAIQLAANEGEEDPYEANTWRKYYEEPLPLFVQPSTVEGFVQHLNTLDASGVGSGFVYSGEIGSELISSKTIIETIQFLAETYDEGSKEVKVLKGKENQSKEIKNLPVSALFVGSQDNILFDDQIKNVFKREFSTKLARRSFFNFNPEKIVPPDYKGDYRAMIAAEVNAEMEAVVNQRTMNDITSGIADTHLPKLGQPITIDKEVMETFLMYKRYNYEISETIDRQFPISRLVRLHLQWKALKLAGALAIFADSDSITIDEYAQAISFVELLDQDMLLFEQELVKEPYELFTSYMHSIANKDKATITLHNLRKQGYIPLTGKPEQRMKELVNLASSYDKDGIYTIVDSSIQFERIVKTQENGVSYRSVSGSKEERARQCSYGFEFVELEFGELADMLVADYAYTPFSFKDGVRAKENIDSGCKWVCLDIDKSTITDEECHFILQNYNHHIVRTSDVDNAFKFRVLVELDSYVDIEDRLWKPFIQSICQYLQLDADILPKSQIFFSYANRNVLSVTGAEPISVKEHLMVAHNQVESKPPVTDLTKKEKTNALADLRDTLWYLYEAEEGQGSILMIRAINHMHDLEAPKDVVYATIEDANSYWIFPMSEQRLHSTIFPFIERKYND